MSQISLVAIFFLTTACFVWASGAANLGVQRDRDIPGRDLYSKIVISREYCYSLCKNDGRCKSYSYLIIRPPVGIAFEVGTCWIKYASGPVVYKKGVTSQIVRVSMDVHTSKALIWGVQKNKNINGHDLYTKKVQRKQCLVLCMKDTRCKSYAWSKQNGGTCWIKTAAGPTIDAPGHVVEIFRPDPVQVPDPKDWIPTFKFDREHKCYPDYAIASLNGNCRGSLDGNVPTYYYAKKCGSVGYRIQYWLFFGYQKGCVFGRGGKHDNDWELIQVNFRQCGEQYCLDSVMYSQHNGWYTRRQTGGKPSAYVGKIAHGMYYNSCCGFKFTWLGPRKKCDTVCTSVPGTECFYYGDFRNPGHHWRPHVLKRVEDVKKGSPVARVRTSHMITQICSKPACKGNSGKRIKDAGCKDNNWIHKID